MDIKETVSCFSLSEIRQEGIKILEKESEVVKLIQQPPGTGKTSLIEAYISGAFRENKKEVIIFATDKNLLALDSYRAVLENVKTEEDYLVLLNSQTASEKGTLGYDITKPDTKRGGNTYFNGLKDSLYGGPVAIFTTPSYIATTYPSYFFRSAIAYCIASDTKLKIVIDEADSFLRSMISEIDISTVLQRKDCRQSKGYSTTNINRDESFLPTNNSISPSKVPGQEKGIITSFLKVSQVNGNSFEEFEFGRPDDFCYLIDKNVEFTDTPGNLHLEFAYSSTDYLAYEVVFLISEIFVLLPVTCSDSLASLDILSSSINKRSFEKISIVRFNDDNEVTLNPGIIELITSVSQTQSQQAASTLLCFCQKIASSNGIHIRSMFCRSGELYKNWLLKESGIDFEGEQPDYLSYDQAVQAYELYVGTEKAELSAYLKRPKIGNLYKLKLIFVESLKLKRLKLIKTSYNNVETDVTLLSATFSDLLLKTCDSPLIVERCEDINARNNWKRLFVHFMDEERFHSLFSPLRLKDEDGLKLQEDSVSRWFMFF
jgi:GTPase SAR1 family protein